MASFESPNRWVSRFPPARRSVRRRVEQRLPGREVSCLGEGSNGTGDAWWPRGAIADHPEPLLEVGELGVLLPMRGAE